MKSVSRRRFLSGVVTLGLGAALAACVPRVTPTPEPSPTAPPATERAPTRSADAAPQADPSPGRDAPSTPAPTAAPSEEPTHAPTAEPTPVQNAYLAVVRGESPEAITTRAIAALGGMERFVGTGANVIIKPNICNANHGPEYASTTNPEVVATLIKLCLGAGARRVRVMDNPFAGTAPNAYVRSGIEEATKAAGGEMEVMAAMGFVETDIPEGLDLTRWPIYLPILEADLVINVPIAKHHNLSRLTLAGKNLMGTIENRPQMHRNLGQRLADIASRVRPQLTVVDAVRILMANGPTGGSLNDVQVANTVIASHDMVAADAYATSLFGLQPSDIGYIQACANMGLGTMDLGSIRIEELAL